MKTVMKLERGKYWRGGAWVDSKDDLILCIDELNNFFYIPKEINKIDLIISDEFMTGSYKVIMERKWNDMLSIHKRGRVWIYSTLCLWINRNGYTNKTLYASIEY